MKTPHSAAVLLLGALAAALPAISAESPKAGAQLVGGSGLVKSQAAPFALRSDASVPNLQSFTSEPLRKRSEPFVRPKRDLGADQFETVFFARTRPVRIRIVTLNEGKSFLAKWDETLRTLFDAFDRNRDGKLDAREVELIYSKQEVKTMLAGGFGFRAQNGGAMPTLDALDKDGDGSVSFEEFAHYYTELTVELARTRETPVYATPDLLTPELFARLDTSGDQKLSEEELRSAEKLLIALDGDEDECVSAFEITSNPVKVKSPILAPGGAGMEMMGRPNGPAKGPADILSFAGPLPGSVVQTLLKRYDKDGDYELSRAEIALPKDAFDKLDADGDGQLDAKELEAWRTGPPDFTVELSTASRPESCTAKLISGKGAVPEGIEFATQTTPERLVIRIFGQTLDLSAGTTTAPYAQPGNPYAYLFPAGKDFLVEKDLVGPQFQMLRVLFDPADWNGDGKLTRAEFDRYFQLQQMVTKQALGLMHQTRTPNLFTLLDGNGDGKLSVKELRTAYERLIPLEPTGGKVITRAILQPSASLRLGHWVYGAYDPNLQPQQNVNGNGGYGSQPVAPSKGPIWFRKMDRNGDGDVSRAEFLGSKADFDAIDANSDGLITLEEAEAYDAKMRPKK